MRTGTLACFLFGHKRIKTACASREDANNRVTQTFPTDYCVRCGEGGKERRGPTPARRTKVGFRKEHDTTTCSKCDMKFCGGCSKGRCPHCGCSEDFE